MSATLLAAALLAQATAPVLTVEGEVSFDRLDVGYTELSQGRARAAIATITNNAELDSDEPAALINLGAAHARLGQMPEARKYYLSAIASRNHHSLQLGDGRWMDSRQAARLGYRQLARTERLAVR